MALPYKSWTVYLDAIRFYGEALRIVERSPRGIGYLTDQISRAASSIVLNLAEGSGKYSPLDKRRYYLSAIGSTSECSALIDLFEMHHVVSAEEGDELEALLEKIQGQLTGLARRCEDESHKG